MSAPRLVNPPPTSGGVPVGGSGTVGTLPIFVGSSTLGNSAITQASGAIESLTLTNAGAGAVPASDAYSNVPLSTVTGSGSGATADIRVVGGSIVAFGLRNPGIGYAINDTLTVTTIGGAGFLFTVTNVVARNTANSEIVARRFGGNASAPLSCGYFNGAVWSALPEIVEERRNASFRNVIAAHLRAGPSDFATPYVLPTRVQEIHGLNANPVVDLSLAASGEFPTVYGVIGSPILLKASTGSSNTIASLIGRGSVNTAESGATLNLQGVAPQITIAAVGPSNTVGFYTAVSGQLALFNPSNPLTVTSFTAFDVLYSFVANVPNVITTWYGLRLRAPNYQATSVVNRYWIAQEDRNGRNHFLAKAFFGSAVGAAQQTAASIEIEAVNNIVSGSITAAGAAYTDGTYYNQLLTGGAFSVQARANITVAGGVVTSVTLVQGGAGYAVGNILSAAIPGGAGFQWTVSAVQGNGDVRLRSASAVFDASGSTTNGVKLPTTPGNADTQTLDAYRENTFTPTIQGGTTAGVGTYTSQVGTFTIIGRCLFFNAEIVWTAHTGTGPVQLAGLPVAAAQLATFGLDSNYAAAGYLRMAPGNTFAQINTINVPATGNYRVSGCYFIV